MPEVKSRMYTLYKLDISYFSGKLEAYLRYKGIPYEAVECDERGFAHVYANTGVKKVPALVNSEGEWLYDTTPTIAWLESAHGGTPVVPEDPALAFVAKLIEDYADEWLWRPAMWWRWMPQGSSRSVGWRIGESLRSRLMSPAIVAAYFPGRQRREWLWRDGMTVENNDAIRDMYFHELSFLEPLFKEQPFLLGSHPSIADFGYFASMFRHFGNDPDPAEVMRRRAPCTYEWTARLWNTKSADLGESIDWCWPREALWAPLLDRICGDYMPYLAQNAHAFQRKDKHFDCQIRSLALPKTKTTRYRVWCLEILQRDYRALSNEAREKVDGLFATHGGLAPLATEPVSAAMDALYQLPRDPKRQGKPDSSWSIRLFGQPRN